VLQTFLNDGERRLRTTAAKQSMALSLSGICIDKATSFMHEAGMRLPCKQTYLAIRDKACT